MKNKKVLECFRVFSLVLVVYALVIISKWYIENEENKSIASYLVEISSPVSVVTNTSFPYINVNFKQLKEESNDVVGWIMISNTNINYAVVQSSNNEYYLNHNFNKKSSQAGWVFMDYKNDINSLDSNTTLYAHNRLDGSMFGDLYKLLDDEWYENNKYIYFNTESETMTWKIFSAYMINKKNYYSDNVFDSVEEFNKFIDQASSNSVVNLDVNVNMDDKILTLYTCDNSNNNRIIVHAKLIFQKEK